MVHLRRFAIFVAVGAIVGVATVGMRELLGRISGDDSPAAYVVTAVAAYVFGIVLSFHLNSRITFSASQSTLQWRSFVAFALVSGVGLLLAVSISVGIRYGFNLDDSVGGWAGTVAFAIAAFLSSAATYVLNGIFVFDR